MRPISNVTRLLAALGLAAGLVTTAAAEETPAQHGFSLVQRNCGVCHAIGATDASPNPAAPLFRELHRRYPIRNLEEALGEGILTGHPQMPEFVFDPEDIEAIMQYLESIQTRQGARAPGPRPRGG